MPSTTRFTQGRSPATYSRHVSAYAQPLRTLAESRIVSTRTRLGPPEWPMVQVSAIHGSSPKLAAWSGWCCLYGFDTKHQEVTSRARGVYALVARKPSAP